MPAAGLPLYAKQENQAILLEFNLGKTTRSSFMDHSIIGDVSVTLPTFVEWLLE